MLPSRLQMRLTVLAALVAAVAGQCAAGQYNSGGCQSCPAGKYSTTTNAGACTDCPAGTQSTAVGPGSATVKCKNANGLI
jgi:hypothetical protein